MSDKLLKNTVVVGSMTLASRVLGLVRDVVLAGFGATAAMDAFFVAFKIPNFMRRLFAEGAFSQAFVPILSEYKEQRDHAAVQQLVNRVAGTLLGILSLVTVVGVLASPVLITLFAPGFLYRDASQFELAAQMLRMTFPYLLFVSLVAFIAGILNTWGRFAAASLAPVWLNVVLIGAALVVAPQLEQPVLALAGGVLVAGLVQLLFLLPAVQRIGLLPRPRWGVGDAGVRRIMKLMLPGIFGSSVAQINLLIDTLIASFLVTGSVTWLYYSDRLMEFPLGVFAIALSTVILPSLSRSHANASDAEFSRTLDWGLRWVLLIGIPSAVALLILASPMITTLFMYRDFTAADVDMAGLSLMAYAIGLPGFMLIKVLAPAFYARKDPRTPVRIAVVALVTNIVLNLAFVVPMVQLEIPGPHAGLALATSIAAWVNAGMLFTVLVRRSVYRPRAGWPRFFLQTGLAGGGLAGLLWWGVPDTLYWVGWNAGERALKLLQWVAMGAVVYFLGLRACGLRLATLWHEREAD
ncbi:MAG: murein biosynthesis integral membrane protein MurJ [Thiohalobacterales bacterium]